MERVKLELELVDRIPKSTLNLDLYIQEKWVRNLIWRELSSLDRILVFAAHSQQMKETLLEDEKFWKACATAGYLDVLKWIFEKIDTASFRCRNRGFGPLETYGGPILNIACSKGHLHILKWIYQKVPACLFNKSDISCAANNGHSHVLEWLIDIGVLEEKN